MRRPHQRQKLLDAFDRSADFVIRAVSSGEADERECIFGQQSVLEFIGFDQSARWEVQLSMTAQTVW